MLFDLRSPGRRRFIKIIYTFLALLMGVGLIGFGIGGNVSGGIFDVGGGCGGQDPNSGFEEEVDDAQARVDKQPSNPAAWAALTRARYQLASTEVDGETGELTGDGRRHLRETELAWNRYLELEPENPDPNLASVMVQAFSLLGKPKEALKAQQIVTNARPSANSFYQLAVFAYAAKDERTAQLASRRALELTPRDRRPLLRERLKEAKASAQPGAVPGAAPGGATPVPTG